MLAKVVDATIDPARIDAAVAAVRDELIPNHLAHEGALQGYWAADARTGHAMVVTMWRDADSLEGAAASDGAARAEVGDRVGLRVHSVLALPVLAASHVTDLTDGGLDPAWIRVTRVDGVAPTMRDLVPQRYGSTLADQSANAGFYGSYWLGDERSPEGCAISLWGHTADLAAGAVASRRRRRRLQRTMGIRLRSVHEYRVVGSARPMPVAALDVVAAEAASA